jgi:hypothetical protein
MRNRFALRGTGRGVSTIGFRRRPASYSCACGILPAEFGEVRIAGFSRDETSTSQRAQQARFAKGTDLRDVMNYCAGGSFTGMARTGGPGFLLSSGSNKYRSGSSST